MQPDAPNDRGHRAHPGLHVIALIELGKGILALLAAGAIASFGAARIDGVIDRLAALSHVDAIHRALSAVARDIDPASLDLVLAAVVAYGALRLIEGWGLWRARAWASWLGAVSVAIYLPFDLYVSFRHPGWIAFVVLAVNLAVLWLLVRDLLGRRSAGRSSSVRNP